MEWGYDDFMLWLSGAGVAILIVISIFLCIDNMFKYPVVKKENNRILIKFKGNEKCHVYIEKDGIITCIYNPERETH